MLLHLAIFTLEEVKYKNKLLGEEQKTSEG
jgi:hypothetical protein